MLRAYRTAHEMGEGGGDKGFYHISIADLSRWIGYEPVKAELRADFEAIRKEPIIYNVLGKNGEKAMRGAGFISEWELSSNWLGFKLPGFLRDCIESLDLKGSIFQALNWSIFNSFTGKYEAVLYKLCKDYIGIARTPYMSIDVFREYMGIRGTEYSAFKDLNKFVISGPIKCINESEISDITVKVEFKREVRKIVGLWFSVTPKTQTAMDFGDDPAFRFAKVAISLAQQKQYLDTKAPELIELSIQRANEYADAEEARGKDVNLGALYRKAIEEDWGKEYESKKARETQKTRAKQAKKITEQQSAAKQHRAELEAQFKKERATEVLNALSLEERRAYAQEYTAEAGEGRAKSYRQETAEFQNPVERVQFSTWLRLRVAPKVTPAEFSSWLKAKERGQGAKE
ncbi:MAG: hypothetical protein ACYC2R_08700 [Burkholderiales bacterium]